MKLLVALLVIVHGLIHLLGVIKAFRPASLTSLTLPVSPVIGMLWLAAALLFLATSAALVLRADGWWALGLVAVVVSTIAIVPSWTDARAGVLVNLVVLAAVALGFLATGPTSLHAGYVRDARVALAAPSPDVLVTDADLATLPDPVRRYLHAIGVAGQPRVRNFHARMHGRIRSAPDARWMPFTAEQYNTFGGAPARLFYMNASMFAVPIYGYHRYAGDSATMLVKALGLVPVARMSGSEATRAETVTMFNDMCLMAPATLIDPSIAWEEVDALTVRASFTNAGHTIRAELLFNDAGELVDFWSDDRSQSVDGDHLRQVRWSTPVRSYRAFGATRLFAGGEARWHDARGAWAYIELDLDDVRYNLAAGQR